MASIGPAYLCWNRLRPRMRYDLLAADVQIDRQTDRHTYRQTYRQTDRQTDRQTYRQRPRAKPAASVPRHSPAPPTVSQPGHPLPLPPLPPHLQSLPARLHKERAHVRQPDPPQISCGRARCGPLPGAHRAGGHRPRASASRAAEVSYAGGPRPGASAALTEGWPGLGAIDVRGVSGACQRLCVCVWVGVRVSVCVRGGG